MSERVYTYAIPSNHGTRYKAEVRTSKARIYLGTMDTREEARQAARDFIEAGIRPPKAKRGPRGKQVYRTKKYTDTPAPFNRVDMMRKIAGWEPAPMSIVPIEFSEANEFVRRHHRHHRPCVGLALYSAAWRAAKALGYRKLITYTLPSEGGASLRGAGWKTVGEAGGGKWGRVDRPRVDMHPTEVKMRWEMSI